MDNKIIDLSSDGIRETKNLTRAARDEVLEVRTLAEVVKRQADAAWELVMMTRDEIDRPSGRSGWVYRKLFFIRVGFFFRKSSHDLPFILVTPF